MKTSRIYLTISLLMSALITFSQQPADTESITPAIREQFIQKALQLRKEENYYGAVLQLDSILVKTPSDAAAMLFKGDLLLQARRFSDAVQTYQKLLVLNFEPTIAKINLSYALFMNHQPNRALNYARNAWEENKTNNSATVNYFNALLWNIKTAEAASFLHAQENQLAPAQLLVLKARLYTTSGNYNDGLKYYDSLSRSYPNKYYVQEYAEVLLGKKEAHLSAEAMRKAKDLFTANEYNAYQQKLKAARLQSAGTELVYFEDVAKNVRIENRIWWQQAEGNTYRFRLNAGRSIYTSAQNEKTTEQFGHVHVSERWNRAWSGETDIHLQIIQPSAQGKFTSITGQQVIKYQPNDRRMFGLYYSTDILNYTTSLLGKNIRSNNLGYIAHIMIDGKTGFYSQGSAGSLTDKNQRFQFFGSFYRLLRTEPTIKTGINFSALHFSDSSIKNYFSPKRYLSSEVFAEYNSPMPFLSKFYLQVQAAVGMQKIEKLSWETALRMEAEVGLRLQHLETGIKYQTSNIASGSGTGYSFNWLTARVAWKW